MLLEKEIIDGEEKRVCSECGDTFVTPLENDERINPKDLIIHQKEKEIIYTNVCWGCGATEKVKVTVEVLD